MCTNIIVDDEEITSPREFASLLGVEPSALDGAPTPEHWAEVVKENGDKIAWEDCCLCGYEIADPLMRAGFWVRVTPWGYEASKITDDPWQMFVVGQVTQGSKG